MKKRLLLLGAVLATCAIGYAQTNDKTTAKIDSFDIREAAEEFTFTETQLNENEDATNDIVQVGSANNVYVNQIGYAWSASHFKFRALDNKYNDVYLNGVRVNGIKDGLFKYNSIGGMNDATRNKDNASPFESNSYSMSNVGGSTNYDFRAADMATGHKVTFSAQNRAYHTRVMYTYGSGLNKHGWAFFGTVGYRWANMNNAAVPGTFYNSLSAFLSAQKVFNEHHSLSLSIWSNNSERATQGGGATDEAYYLKNNYLYNPSWGYQNGKKRSSRIINEFSPSVLLTWDFKINDKMKLTTSAFFKYGMKAASALKYNDAQNPAADYWKNMPSSKYNPWTDHTQNWSYGYDEFMDLTERWQNDNAFGQIQWDDIYAKNAGRNATGQEAAYYMTWRHQNDMAGHIGSTFDWKIDKQRKFLIGIQLASNKSMNYQTIGDMLGANYLTNINRYAIGKYAPTDDVVQFDLLNPNKSITSGDVFGYDYNLYIHDYKLWTTYTVDRGIAHSFISAKIGGTTMWREGKMMNGIYKDYSYGNSSKASFLDGGFKIGTTLNLGRGNAITFGTGYEANAPKATVAFQSPEMCNYYVNDLKTEKVISADLGYALNCKWLQLNINGYFYHTYNGTDFKNFYDDDKNSFTYNSLTGIKKQYYGVELGAKFKITSNLNIVALGTYSDAKYVSNATYTYMRSVPSTLEDLQESNPDICHTKGMRESGTPLSVASLALNYNIKRWFLNLTGSYYDRIYLSFAPNLRTETTLNNLGMVDGEGNYIVPEQAKGNGGFMLDASIGHQFTIAHHPLSVNLSLCNLTNKRDFCTGGYEQSRTNYSTRSNGTQGNERIYDFSKNPKKFYNQGFNFMLNINYRF